MENIAFLEREGESLKLTIGCCPKKEPSGALADQMDSIYGRLKKKRARWLEPIAPARKGQKRKKRPRGP